MRDIGISGEDVKLWFAKEMREQYALVRVPDTVAALWNSLLGAAIRRAYVTDRALRERAQETGRPESEILSAKLPDPGSTMAGDFGEVLVFLFHATEYPHLELIGPKKWRLKQDRIKPAPYSDVVQFAVPQWPQSSADDRILCTEVKTKSTDGASTPISSAITDSEKDKTSRMAKTLLWLRDRALGEDLGSVSLAHLERFINAADHPQAHRDFRAVAVICESLEADELLDTPENHPADHPLVVIVVPRLKERYESAFSAALQSLPTPDPGQ